MNRFSVAVPAIYATAVTLTALALLLLGSDLHGWAWAWRVLGLPAVSLAIIALAARRRTARDPQDVAPWGPRR